MPVTRQPTPLLPEWLAAGLLRAGKALGIQGGPEIDPQARTIAEALPVHKPASIGPLSASKELSDALMFNQRQNPDIGVDPLGLAMGMAKVYHGSPHKFTTFDMSKGRTAKHIYSTPIKEDAAKYGGNIYEIDVSGKIGDFMPESRGPKEYKELKNAFDDGHLSDYFDGFDDFIDALDSGDMYQRFASPSAQNDTIDALLSQGYDAVKIPDAGFGGSMSESIVFGNTPKAKILKRNNEVLAERLLKQETAR